MPSFQITVSPSRRAAARFIGRVRRDLVKAVSRKKAAEGITQSEIARRIDVHRSVISRELRGYNDLTLGRVAELAWALGLEPAFELKEPPVEGNGVSTPPYKLDVGSTSKSAASPSSTNSFTVLAA